MEILASTAPHLVVQRDVARSYSTLSHAVHIHLAIIETGGLDALFTLACSLDIACQRYATLTLTTWASSNAA